MKTLRKTIQSDATGTVRIDVPVSASLRQFDVVVVWQETEGQDASLPRQWPEGWLEATAGSIDDPSFVRPAQGEFEVREEL